MLHAWWGLTPFFTRLCDRLADEGFVAFAPDLHHGRSAATIDEAKVILAERDFPAVQETALAALEFLRRHQAVKSDQLGAVGFSMGAAFALLLQDHASDAFAAIVMFYGQSGADLTHVHAAVLGHYGGTDDWEPLDHVRQMQGDTVTTHIYPHAGHWFFEDDRPDHFHEEAAALAWDRTVDFLRVTMGTAGK